MAEQINPESAPKFACVQMVSTTSVAQNMLDAANGIAAAVAAGAQVVVLPEYFCLMGQNETDKLAVAEAFVGENVSEDTPLQSFLRAQAMTHGVYLIGGTIPLKSPEADKVYNTMLIYAPTGALEARYDKIHLFGFQNGQERYSEGDAICAGAATGSNAPAVWHSPWGVIGLSICYDVRFP